MPERTIEQIRLACESRSEHGDSLADRILFGEAAAAIGQQGRENERFRDWIRDVSGLGDHEIDEFVLSSGEADDCA